MGYGNTHKDLLGAIFRSIIVCLTLFKLEILVIINYLLW